MSDLAMIARQRIEAKAESVSESRCAYVEDVEPRHFHTTICNGAIKPEGEPPVGCFTSEDELPVDDFVACCLSLRGEGKRLVWRRFPAVDHDFSDDGYRISARLSWL